MWINRKAEPLNTYSTDQGDDIMITIRTAFICNNLSDNDLSQQKFAQLLYFYKSGDAKLITAEKRHPLHDGSIAYIPPQAPQARIYSRDGIRFARILFTTDRPIASEPLCVFSDSEYTMIGQDIKKYLYWRDMESSRGYQGLCDGLMELIFDQLEKMMSESASEREVGEYKAELIQNISDPEYKVSDFMATADLTRSNVSKKFKLVTGETVKQFFDRKKIEFAQQFILNKRDKCPKLDLLSEVCGYDEEYYFLRLFKKQVGMSPSEYKEKNDRE